MRWSRAWRENLTGARAAAAGTALVSKDALLREADFVTPHIGYVTERSYAMFYTQAVENIRAWMAGTPIRLLISNVPPSAA